MLGEESIQPRSQLVGLHAVVGFVVEQKGAVAGHAHVLQRACQAALIGVGEKLHFSPTLYDSCHRVGIFLVEQRLHLSHRHQQVLIGAHRQLSEQKGLGSH